MSVPTGTRKRPKPFSAYLTTKKLAARVQKLEDEVASLREMVESLQPSEGKA